MKTQTGSLCLLLCLCLSAATVTTVTSCAGDKYNRSTGQYIDDKSLAVRVHKALSENPDYKFDDVHVDTFRGTVQLSGFVDTSDQKSRAAEIAKGVQGVQEVSNKINIKKTQ